MPLTLVLGVGAGALGVGEAAGPVGVGAVLGVDEVAAGDGWVDAGPRPCCFR